MNNESSFIFICIVFLIIGAFYQDTTFSQVSLFGDSFEINQSNNFRVFIILHFDFISCPLCWQTLDELVKILNSDDFYDKVIGVVTIEPDKVGEERSFSFFKKQIEGFVLGNNIFFPVYMDRNGKFVSLVNNAPLIMIFEKRVGEIHYYLLRKDTIELIKEKLININGDVKNES